MPTLKEFMSEGKALGKSYETVMRGVDVYRERHGAFDDEPSGNPQLANETLNNGLMYNATTEQSEVVTSVLTPEDMEFQTATTYYDQKFGTNHTPPMVTAQIKYEYGNDATAATANQMNRKGAGEVFAKSLVAGVPETYLSIASGAYLQDAGIRRKMADIVDAPTESKPQSGKDLALTFGRMMWSKMFRTQAEEGEEIAAIAKEDADMIYEKLGLTEEDKARTSSQIGTGLAQLSAMPLYALPPVGIGATTMRFYDEGYNAALEKGMSEDEAHNTAAIYTASAAPVGIIADKLILAKGGLQAIKASKPLAGQIARNIVAVAQKAGVNFLSEGASETIEDTILQQAILGEEVNWAEKLKTFLISGLVGAVGGVGAEVTQAGKAPWTLGDANRTRKQNTNEEIDAIVEGADIPAEQKPLMDEMLKTPSEQNTDAFNAWEPEVAEKAPVEAEQVEPDLEPVLEEKVAPEVREAAVEAGEIVGVSKAENIAWREAQNQQELPETVKRAQTQEMQAAKDEGLNEQADRLAESLIENPRPVEAKEVAGLLLRRGELDNELKDLYARRNEAEEAGDVIETARLNSEIDVTLSQTDRLMQGVARAGTKQAQGLASLGMFMNKETFELVDVMNRARTLAKRPLTNKEKADIEAGVKEIERLDEIIRKQKKKVDELSDEEVKIRQEKAKLRHRVFRMRQKTGWDKYTGVADFWRAMKLSMDMGYFGRQGGKALLSQPQTAIPAMREATSTLFSEKNFYTIYDKLTKSKKHTLRVKSGLEILDIDGEFEAHQEAINSPLAEKIPWVRASNRHMITGLNVLRAGMFDKFVQKNPDLSQAEYSAYAKFVNEYTGRGSLGFLEKSSHGLTNFLLAPRWVTSNWQTVVSERNAWVKGEDGKKTLKPKVLKAIVAEKAKFYTAWSALASAFAAIGWEVGDDPEDSDFMKFRKGDLVIDLTAGSAQTYRLIFLAAETALATRGMNELEHDADLTNVLKNYASYKFAPSVTVPLELTTGKNIIGQERAFLETVASMTTPIIIESAYHDIKEDADWGDINAAMALEAFGVGSQIYEQ